MKLGELLRVESATLRSRFGRRLLLLFIVLALLPICTLALVTYWSVTHELRTQSGQRLREQTKSQAMALLERLVILERELEMIGSAQSTSSYSSTSRARGGALAARIRSLAVVDERGTAPLEGAPFSPPELSAEQQLHLDSGATLLAFETDALSATRVFMALAMQPLPEGAENEPRAPTSSEVLWSEIDPAYLWWGPYRESNLPALTELCLVEPKSAVTLFCSSGEPAALPVNLGAQFMSSALGEFSWSRGGKRHFARHRTLLLDRLYGLPGVTVVLSESAAKLSGPLRDFRLSFLPIVLLTIWVVLLLSVRQIRRSLVPLERLREGTSGIAAQRFSTRVEVESGDEFEELADSFNTMAHRLGRQFEALGALTEIQSAVLAANDQGEIAAAVLKRLDRLLPHHEAVLLVLDSPSLEQARSYYGAAGEVKRPEALVLPPEDLWWTEGEPELRIVEPSAPLPSFLMGLRRGDRRVLMLPIRVDGAVVAILAASSREGSIRDDLDPKPLRQLGGQVAQALSKAALIRDLEELSVGTLSALARTIDANSQWTLGHSERVAELALRIGEAMGLSRQELNTLERGALLHDIGKLGVASALLDKPAKLTAEEMNAVRRHVEIGARILEPVPSLADTLPLIWQHHERVDGKGYPRGLHGSEIHLLARILAVADVYDALRSARPYRRALELDEVVQHLKDNSGKQFDPAIVQIFSRILTEMGGEAGEANREGASSPVRAAEGW